MIFNNNRFLSVAAAALLALSGTQASFLDQPSVATYWGQNSVGTQQSLATYCDDSSDVIVMSFTLNFQDGSLPLLNLANACSGPNFDGTNLLSCPSVGADIKTCQKKGKTVLMSLGGAAGVYGFTSDANAEAFADTLWNIYGGGSSSTRPFGDAVLDGFDLDIEGGGPTGYAAMVTRLRSHFASDKSKDYYITAAPQCPYPDAMLGTVIDDVGFDAVFVQFYNNYCATASTSFNFNTWDSWAKETSPNKDVKVFIGIPGSSASAGSGYVPFGQLQTIVQSTYSTYSSLGGVMLWDAASSYSNMDVSPSYQSAVAGLIHGLKPGKAVVTTTTTTTTATTTKVTTTTTTVKATTPATKTSGTPNTKSSSVSTKSTTTAKTTTTKSTTKTVAPTPTASPGAPGVCVKNGDTCATEGQLVCSGNSFGTCNHGSWLLQACPSGLTCFSTADGSSIYCGQGTGSTTCNAKNAVTTTLTVLTQPDTDVVDAPTGPTAKGYKNSKVTAQFSVSDSTATTFNAVINARRLNQQAFGSTITVQFKVASNIKITSVDGGKVTQSGNNVKISFSNAGTKTMTAIIPLSGKITSGVFTAPSISTFKFT